MFTEPDLLLSRLIFVGLVIEAAEFVWLRRSFDRSGVFARHNLAVLTATTPWHQCLGATWGAGSGVAAVAALQAVGATVVVATGLGQPTGVAAALVCLLTAGYLRMRRQIGGSGAEQLTFIVLVTFAIVLLAGGSDGVRLLGDGFIAAQVMLAYLAAGIAKAASPMWRRGGALVGILSTCNYGTPAVATLLTRYPALERALGWSVILWEITFVAVLIAPHSIVIVILLTGAAFHIGCALLMGLNRFGWAFCGCYPAVLVTIVALH